MRLSDFDYALPAERIAQTPLPRRDHSRLLVLDRSAESIAHRRFFDLPLYLRPGDVLVLNDTRVTAQRLFGSRPGRPGERVETFLTHRVADGLWRGLVRPGRKMPPGTEIEFGDGLRAEVLERTDDRGGRLLRFTAETGSVEDGIAAHGDAPLPPYITQPLSHAGRERYQTVYATREGSAAAPTAGLHFTQALLARIEAQGVRIARVTLHVGLGTFRPIETEDVAAHAMHPERVTVSAEAAEAINGATGRIVAVGTTSARTLESAAVADRRIAPMDGETGLYITPGHRFQVVDALITNFHMPRSTLLVLVSALAGRDAIRRAYDEALRENYRFLSFGDAMLII
ncbi:MAG: tRNA preQ1(34) S-adenosylmethionine ribosyltransferase-isomerase QueA [Armatimonadetes bacterium]|nr:tRNA preQ1(34) S-adenosylmethionine ribosyltransferase-isomerase QueA [Armatimonadota bacterium]